jgi:hypothetical protein
MDLCLQNISFVVLSAALGGCVLSASFTPWWSVPCSYMSSNSIVCLCDARTHVILWEVHSAALLFAPISHGDSKRRGRRKLCLLYSSLYGGRWLALLFGPFRALLAFFIGDGWIGRIGRLSDIFFCLFCKARRYILCFTRSCG